jgi:CheY-specific phosphatase CheX
MKHIDEALSRVAVKTLEKLAFMFSFPDPEESEPEDAMRVAVDFKGVFTGSLLMEISRGAVPELAANMLGIEPACDSTLEQCEDALKEALNVICGNLLPVIAGSEEVFHIDAPRLVSGPGAEPSFPAEPSGVSRLLLENGRCRLLFFSGRLPGVS